MSQTSPPTPPARRSIPRWAIALGALAIIVVLGTIWWVTRDATATAVPGGEPTPTLGLLLQGTPVNADSTILGGSGNLEAQTPTTNIPAPPVPAGTTDPAMVPTLGPGTPVLPHTSGGQQWPCGTPMPDGRVITEGGPIPCATTVP